MDDGSLASRSSSYHSCQHSGYVPVHFSNDEERDYPGLLKKSYTEVLKVGFSLNWSAQNCSNCETIGGRCGFERNQICLVVEPFSSIFEDLNLNFIPPPYRDIATTNLHRSKPSRFKYLFSMKILLFHLHLCFADAAHDEFKACGVNYNCGQLVNISYPFWGNDRQSFCGRREFGLSCKNNETTTIHINSWPYIVVNISQSDHRMTLARSELFDDYCPDKEIGGGALDFSPFKYSNNDLNLSLWYDCPILLEVPKYFVFECVSKGERSGRTNYALEESETTKWSPYNRECGIKIDVTITSEIFQEGKTNRTVMMERGMKEGFEVEYEDIYSTACEACKEYGGACGRNATKEFLCICNNGEVHLYVCTPPPPPPSPPGRRRILAKAFIGAFSGTGGLIIFIIIIAICYMRKNKSNKDNIEESYCLRGSTEEEKEMTRKMIIVGLHCIQTLPDDRPSMTDVIAMLEGSGDGLQIPPKPNLFGPPTFEHPQPSSSSSNEIPNDSLIL
uniref:non-specific serine/threonine protein kinase n=1 Tax=Cucumis sativus TaxID=3659 RepID=A0A0A0LTP4_CUCSA